MSNKENYKKAKIFLESKDWLYQEYILKNKSLNQIAQDLGIDDRSVAKAIIFFEIKKDKKKINEARVSLIKKTNLEKYGVISTLQVKEVREKRKSSMLEKYGSEHALQNEGLLKKSKQTQVERYGDIYNKTEQAKVTFKETCQKKYGVPHFAKNAEAEKFLNNCGWLREQYLILNKSSSDMSKFLSVSINTVCKKLKEFNLIKDEDLKYLDRNKKSEKTNLEKRGVLNTMQDPSVKEKARKTLIERYGVDNALKNEEFHRRQQESCQLSTGYKSPLSSKEIQEKARQTRLKKYGVEYAMQDKKILQKGFDTKRKNNSFHTSKPEESIFKILGENYPVVERNYSSDARYPFHCDFYIRNLDLFIELQSMWTHGKEPYSGKVPDRWQTKAKTSLFYQNAIQVYTLNDPKKREVASSQNLNFLEIWNSDLKRGSEWVLFLIKLGGLSLNYTEEVLQNEYSYFLKKNGSFVSPPVKNKIILHFQKHFYRKERQLWNIPSIREKLVANRLKFEKFYTKKQILSGFKISGIHVGFSFFSPLWVKAFIEKYNVSSIYDPCAGWGHRLLGSSSITYIGNDSDPETYRGLQEIKKFFKMDNALLYNNLAENFVPPHTYDAVFTCPPYFDLEEYHPQLSSTVLYPDYSSWLNVWWRNVVKKSISQRPRLFAFVINGKLKEDLKSICISENLIFLEEISISSGVNHFQRAKKTHRKERLLVFKVPC